MAINVFVPKFRTEEILVHIKECLDKGWTGLGFKTQEFEKNWKEHTGFKNAHFLSSNTVGLHLAINIFKNHFKWNDGDEIISTSLTFISTNHAIMYENLKPVFADVDDYLCLDPISVEERITNKTKAVMYVGIGGNVGQYQKIVELCKKHNLILILDAAHMAGTKINNQQVGQDADVTIFSFQAVKNLPTGDSGMICFRDDDLDIKARKQAWLGISKDTYERFNKNSSSYKWKYDVEDVGFKYHGNSIMASIGLVQLNYLEQDNARRREIGQLYNNLLKDIDGVEIVKVFPKCISSRHLFQICVDNRDKVIQYLYDNEIYPGVHYCDNIQYSMYSYAEGTCPNAREKSETLLSLPLHLNISNEDVKHIVKVLLNAIKANE
jgi:dTDP-4-amino-4,6-dideoxygalactose transaminase